MPITILPYGRRISPEIVNMPVSGQECPICYFMFMDMTPTATVENHIARCTESKAEEYKKMVAMGYKLTTKGWVMP